MNPELSILIPTLNESANITELLTNINVQLHTVTDAFEIVVVDGGSTDNTQELARAAGARVIRQRSKGYGAALKESFPQLNGIYIVTMDADFSHDPFFIREMWKRRDKAAAIVASRYIACGESDASVLRSFLSKILNYVFAYILSIPLRDFSSGFRMYRKDILSSITIESSDYDILEEIIIKLFCQGYAIHEVPFHYAARNEGQSKTRIVRLGLVYIGTLFKMWKLRNSIQSADYDSRAYDSRLYPQRYWQRKRYHIIQNMIRDVHGHIVDVGCGSSRIMQNLLSLFGLDIKINKLRFVQKSNPKVIQGTVSSLPFHAASIDCIICSQVIEHVPEDQQPISELSRVIKPGGWLILGTPDYGSVRWRIIEFLYKKILPLAYADEHITQYTRQSLKKLLSQQEFDIIDHRYILGGELIVKARKRTAGGTQA